MLVVENNQKITNQDINRETTNENLRYLVQQITQAQEEERLRIARELHDSTIQSLIAVLHQLERFLDKNQDFDMPYIRFLLELNTRIKGIIQEVRHLSSNLRPSILDHLGLLPSIEYLTDEFSRNYGFNIKLITLGNQYRFLPELELSIFRVIQEALQNIARHARANLVQVIFEFKHDLAQITIKDNGIGIKGLPGLMDQLPRQKKLGLTGMFERVKLIGGEITLESSLGKGTIIVLKIPVTDNTTGK